MVPVEMYTNNSTHTSAAGASRALLNKACPK